MLEDHGGVGPGRLLGGRDLVVLGERQCQRLLAQHPGTRLEGGHRLLPVQRRRGADEDQVGACGVQHRGHGGVPGDLAAREFPEGVESALVHVDGGDQFRALGVGPERGQMAAADDGAGADHGYAAAGWTGHTGPPRTSGKGTLTCGESACSPGVDPRSPAIVLTRPRAVISVNTAHTQLVHLTDSSNSAGTPPHTLPGAAGVHESPGQRAANRSSSGAGTRSGSRASTRTRP